MNTFIDNLRQEVLSCSISGVKLQNDLRKISKVYSVGATEAVVFYSARILEAVMKDAHLRFFGDDGASKQDKSSSLVDMEKRLYEYNQLPQQAYYWSEGLRLLGNDVRHTLRNIGSDEADCALLFLEFILKWYFCDFPLGARQPAIYKMQAGSGRKQGQLLLDLAWELGRSKPDKSRLLVIFGSQKQEYLAAFSKNLALPILMLEMFIDSADHSSAVQLVETLTPYIRRTKGALAGRFKQLKALVFRRMNRLDDALKVIEPTYNKQLAEHPRWIEDETAGILAGIYKGFWEQQQDSGFLAKSHATYLRGWKLNKNPYLGINAATTALWLEKPAESASISKEVRTVLEKRQRLIRQKNGDKFDLSYWDLVTLAEACLLLKELDKATELYDLAFSRHSSEKGRVGATQKQFAGLAKKLMSGAALSEFIQKVGVNDESSHQ